MMIKNKIIVFFLIFGGIFINAQTIKYPVTVSVVATPPNSIYLADYYSVGSSKLTANVVFNDFNEPSWNVYLRVTFESNTFRLQTRPGFVPQEPITLIPGVVNSVSGERLLPYLDYNNILVTGYSLDKLRKDGKLPDGFYKITIEVFDFTSGKSLSNQGITMLNLAQLSPPLILAPIREAYVKPTEVQNIMFQWQSKNADPLTTEYILSMYEIMDPNENPAVAILNGKARQIVQSSPVNTNTYMYSLSDPILTKGKIYAFTVTAKNTEGRDVFRNNGISEASWFYYGYPQGGKISLIKPVDKKGFNFHENITFVWGPPSLRVPNQPIDYNLKVVKKGNSLPEVTIDSLPFFEKRFPTNYNGSGDDLTLPPDIQPAKNQEYVWQVKAFSDGEEVAKSTIYSFYGPPLLRSFMAGDHMVTVEKTFNEDASDLSGIGRVTVTEDGKEQLLNFKHISLKKLAGFWILEKGIITQKLDDFAPIELTPKIAENRKALFLADSIQVNPDGLMIKGRIEWDLPLSVTASKPVKVASQQTLMGYNNFKVTGRAQFAADAQCNLAEPYLFKMKISRSSYFDVYNNTYEISVSGTATLPSKVKSKNYDVVNFDFSGSPRILYIRTGSNGFNDIRVLGNSDIWLEPVEAILDFSESESPGSFQSQPQWKGLFLDKYNLNMHKSLDRNGHLYLFGEDFKAPVYNGGAWVVGQGLCMRTSLQLGYTATYNSFQGKLSQLDLTINNNSVSDSYLKGVFKIPVISEEKDFGYTIPLTDDGLQNGYLNESLDGYSFVFNPEGGSQKLNIKVNRAVFESNDHLVMNLDINWPSMGITLKALDYFMVWGNNNIGFGSENSMMSLSKQVTGKINDFPVTITDVAAGKSPGLYAFGISAKLTMSEDVSGANGPPVVNVYSIDKNNLIGQYTPVFVPPTPAELQASRPKAPAKSMFDNLSASSNEDALKKFAEDAKKGIQIDQAEILARKAEEMKALEDNVKKEAEALNSKSATEEAKPSSVTLTAAQDEELLRRSNLAASKLTAKLTAKADSFSASIINRIDSIGDEHIKEFEGKIRTAVMGYVTDFTEGVEDDVLKRAIISAGEGVINDFIGTLSSDVQSYLDTAFYNPLRHALSNQVHMAVTVALYETSKEFVVKDLRSIDVDSVIKVVMSRAIGKDFGMERLTAQIKLKVLDIFKKVLNPERVLQTLSDALAKNIVNVAKEYAVEKTKEYVSNLVSENMPEGVKNVMNNIPIDMGGIAAKLAKGDLKGALSLDKVRIALNSGVVKLTGEIEHKPDDPTFGAVWIGLIKASISVPKKFSFQVNYLSGKKDGVNYWFTQIKPAGGSTNYNDRTVVPLDTPLYVGPIEIAAIAGRLYHHMKDDGKAIVPSSGIRYGAYLSTVLYDSKTEGKTARLAMTVELVVASDGEYEAKFNGDLQLVNTTVDVFKIDESALAKGSLYLYFNSKDNHFIGKGSCEIKKEGVLCMGGSILFDFKPGAWRVAIGTKEEKIYIVPTCVGWGGTGWLDVNQNTAEIGLGLMYAIYVKKDLNLKVVKLGILVDGALAGGIQVKAQYNPSFVLMEAGLWASLKLKVSGNYEVDLALIKSSGDFTLVDILANADLLLIFNPPPKRVKGSASGYISLMGIFSTDFSAEFDKEF